MTEHKKNILLFALESIDNVGDEILRETTEYILSSFFSDHVDIQVAQLKPTQEYLQGTNKAFWLVSALIRKSLNLLNYKFYRVRNVSYIIAYKQYYKKLIKTADAIILPVGMLKYSTQDFGYLFHLINKLASKYDKPVLMSAMSPQKADVNDWRYYQLVEAVNMPSVKMITTRDGQKGVDIIRNDYLKREISCDYVGDPALWIPECYSVKRQKRGEELLVPCVGINIIREGVFDDYNKSFTDEEMFQVYVQLINYIRIKGWKWFVYTNGMVNDIKVLRKLQNSLGFSEEHVAQQHKSAKEYVEKVCMFDVVFGARLHACITAVALGIPVVGFVWEDKLRCFSETMGISQFFFRPADMTAEAIVRKMEEALRYAFDFGNRDDYKEKTISSIKNFIGLNK